MVLDDVAGGTDTVVVAAPPAETDVLGHGDLHAVDVVRVQHRLEHLVGEAQCQEVLDRLLAQVVVDAEHRRLREHAVDHSVELLGALEVVTERLLDHHPAPAALRLVGQPGFRQLLADLRERLRRDRQVERVIAAGAALDVEFVQGLLEAFERGVVVESALYEPEPLRQAVPDLLAERRAGVLFDRVEDDLAEILVRPIAAGEAHQREARAAASRGWPGRRWPASASCGPGHR